MRESEGLIFGIIIIIVSTFHLVYAVRTGKVIMGATWRLSRAESPATFWFMMAVTLLVLAVGLYLAVFGIPEPAGS